MRQSKFPGFILFANLRENTDLGGVMVLFVMLLAVLLGVIGLAIDSAIMTASHQQHRQAAEAAALSALKSYSDEIASLGDSPTPDQISTALNNAVTVARTKLNDNIQYSVQRSLWQNSSVAQNLIGIRSAPAADKKNGTLTPIEWYPPEPSASCDSALRESCPCNQACYRTRDDNVLSNGLLLNYKTNPDSQVGAVLTKLVGASPMQFEVNIKTAISARNAVFLIDLSNSMLDESHSAEPNLDPPDAPYCDGVRYFTYPLLGAATCATAAQSALSGYYDDGTFYEPDPNNRLGWGPVDHYARCVHDAAYSEPPGSSNKLAQYACQAYTLETLAGATSTDRYYLDTSVRPEPLSSVLDGVHYAMEYFKDRRVPRDRFGIVGFDDRFFKNRMLANNITADLATASLLPVTDAEFDEFFDATDTSDAITTPERVAKYLIPRRGSLGTDLPGALILARQLISRTPGYQRGQNFVVAFSDGLPNCLNAASAPFPVPGQRCFGGPGTYATAMEEQYYSDSYDLATAELANYVNDRVALHFFPIGESVAPHELAWRASDGSGCASQDEIRARGWNLVDASGAFNSLPFYGPNNFSSYVIQTGGLWAPIRPCKRNNAGSCEAFPPDDFRNKCKAMPTHDDIVVNGATRPASDYWDADGRIVYDPAGRSTQYQVIDHMQRILSRSPFMLVEE